METLKRSWKLQEFVAHKANVNCLAMGHKSKQVLATGGDDKKVNLWAIGRQSCLMSLSGHTTPVECVCFGHSEDLVCAGSQTGALKIWDLEAAKLFRTFTGHKGAIKCMDFHPYGDYLTTGSCDSNIKLWDTRKRGCIVTYSDHRIAVNSLQFSPDGQWIASADDDGLVKVWDVRMGKVLQEFCEHTAAVTCVKFHPHEFLLASCGSDRIVNFWDMEKFQLVSKFEKDNTSIRHMVFSEDGGALLGCGGDGLHVVGWEPARALDALPAHWGAVHDVTVAQNQLIAGSFHSTYVVLWGADLSSVHPFGGPAPPSPPPGRDLTHFQKGHSVRKSFSKEKPKEAVVRRRTLLDERTAEESASGTEPDDDAAPAVRDYTEVFRPSRALNRTPPPATSLSSEECSLTGPESLGREQSLRSSLRDLTLEPRPAPLVASPLASPVAPLASPPPRARLDHSRIPTSVGKDSDRKETFRVLESPAEPAAPPAPAARAPAPPLHRHNSYKERSNAIASNLRPSNSDMSLGPPTLGPRSLSFSRMASDTRQRDAPAPPSPRAREAEELRSPRAAPPAPAPPSPTAEPPFVPFAADRPVGLDLDDFLPRGAAGGRGRARAGPAPSEQEALGVVMRGHDAMMTVLTARQRSLQIFHSVRVNKNLKAALQSVIALEDSAVILDILNVMAHKPSLWNLDICLLMLPKIYELLQSKYESYMQCGCNALRLIVRNFSSVVRANVSAPAPGGSDIPREERYAKCLAIHRLLVDVRAFLLKRQTLQGRLGAAFRDLHTLLQQGLD